MFLGSSTFQALDTGNVAAHAVNLSVGGETARCMARRIASYRAVAQARTIVVNIGLNDLLEQSAGSDVPFDALFARFPGVPIIALALQQPDPGRLRHNRAPALATEITTANAKLQTLCDARVGCQFLPNPADGSPQGRALLSADGLHLSREGYAQLRDRLRDMLQGSASRT